MYLTDLRIGEVNKLLASFIELFFEFENYLNMHTLPNAVLTILLLSFCHSFLMLLLSFFVSQTKYICSSPEMCCCLSICNNVNFSNLAIEFAVKLVIKSYHSDENTNNIHFVVQ